MLLRNMNVLTPRLNPSVRICYFPTLKILTLSFVLVWLPLLGLLWTLKVICTMFIKVWRNLNNSLSMSTISLKTVLKTILRLFPRLFLSIFLKTPSLSPWTLLFNCKKNTSTPRLISLLPRMSKLNVLLMIYYKLLCSTLLILMLILFFLKKPSVLKDITSGTSIKLYLTLPKTPLMLWSIVFAVRRSQVLTPYKTKSPSSK